jgi:hypothetical protein
MVRGPADGVKVGRTGYTGGVDGLMLVLVAVVVLCVVLVMVFVDVPDQIHSPVEYRGVGGAVKVVVTVALALWVFLMFVH